MKNSFNEVLINDLSESNAFAEEDLRNNIVDNLFQSIVRSYFATKDAGEFRNNAERATKKAIEDEFPAIKLCPTACRFYNTFLASEGDYAMSKITTIRAIVRILVTATAYDADEEQFTVLKAVCDLLNKLYPLANEEDEDEDTPDPELPTTRVPATEQPQTSSVDVNALMEETNRKIENIQVQIQTLRENLDKINELLPGIVKIADLLKSATVIPINIG